MISGGRTRPPAAPGRDIRPRIARKGIEPSTTLGRHRWTIERTMSWVAGCRRRHRRHERKADHFLASTVGDACPRLGHRRRSPRRVPPVVARSD
ncbi:hypothetical protein [Streptomyces sp. NPDC127036]|uniref:hypothetical protein n=1 Tax=unclassified Streptomyces TaxID=2593676 RepID=UPI0036470651